MRPSTVCAIRQRSSFSNGLCGSQSAISIACAAARRDRPPLAAAGLVAAMPSHVRGNAIRPCQRHHRFAARLPGRPARARDARRRTASRAAPALAGYRRDRPHPAPARRAARCQSAERLPAGAGRCRIRPPVAPPGRGRQHAGGRTGTCPDQDSGAGSGCRVGSHPGRPTPRPLATLQRPPPDSPPDCGTTSAPVVLRARPRHRLLRVPGRDNRTGRGGRSGGICPADTSRCRRRHVRKRAIIRKRADHRRVAPT